MEPLIFTWSDWDAPKGEQPVADQVFVQYIYRNKDEKSEKAYGKAGDLDWGFGCNIVSYRYQIMQTVD